MTPPINEFGQRIGDPVPGWTPRPRPPRAPMEGRLVRLEPLNAAEHATALHEAYSLDKDARHWTYLPYGPFATAADYAEWVKSRERIEDPVFYAILERKARRPVGVASYLRINPVMGCIEVGHLRFSGALRRTPAATEAMYLMMRRAFEELGYRRYEWKCDSLNEPSRKAALRLGFTYEGKFRQDYVQKGRNRDNDWFSILDNEWPTVKAALEAWLEPDNFDAAAKQRRRLDDLRGERAARGR